MRKLAIIGHQDSRTTLLNFLQEAGMLQISPLSLGEPLSDSSENYELFLSEIKAAITVIDAAAGVKKSFIESFAPHKETIKQEVLSQTVREFDWRNVINEINKVDNELANLKNLEGKLLADLQVLRPFVGLNVPLKSLNSRGDIAIIAGSCRTKSLLKLKESFAAKIAAGEIVIAGQTAEKSHLIIALVSTEAAAAGALLDHFSFEKIVLPMSKLTATEEAGQIESLLKKVQTDRKTFKRELAGLTKHKKRLTYIYDYYLQKNDEKSAKERLAYTKKAFILTGWGARKKLAGLKIELEKLDPSLALEEIEPDKGEQPPSLIENAGIFGPFELVTKIFGPPSPGDMDPTAPLSFFFILFFALCLSDVGYGILLAAAAIYYKKTLTLSEGGKNLLNLLLWGGVATIFAGIITGSYFAIDLNTLPAQFSIPLKKVQLIDPIKSPLNMLIISLILGIIQIITGLALGLYWRVKNGEWLNGLLDFGLWIVFLLALVFYGTAAALSHPATTILGRLSIAGAVSLVLTQGRHEPGLIKKAVSGILSLYRTTGFLGDTLSYSRILALMMTTSIIGMVINIIADLTKGSVPILGYLIMAIVLVIGHVFNMVISVLGAFVHSARLQLVEYFGKFYEGGGKLFKPFRRETVYTIIESK